MINPPALQLPLPRTCPLNPPPEYARLRVDAPIARVSTPRGDSAWMLTRHADIRKALADKRLSADPRTPGYPAYFAGDLAVPPGFFMLMDAPDHPRLKALVINDFIGKPLEAMRPVMERIIDDQIARLLSMTTPVDFIASFALPVSSGIICEVLGVPVEDQRFVQKCVDTFLDRSQTPEAQQAAATEVMTYFDRIVTEKEASPGDDVIGRLIADPKRRAQLSHDELVGVAALLLFGAYDTMAQIIGLGTVSFLRNPSLIERLLGDPDVASTVVDELVRFHSVNHSGIPRVATVDLEIAGQTIKAGEGVIAMLSSGNRDETVYDRPDALDIARQTPDHLGFGHGMHKCIGFHYARMELLLVFRNLFERIPTLRIAVPIEDLRYRDEMVLYGLRELPVEW